MVSDPITFDLIMLQTLGGAELGTLHSAIPASEALTLLQTEQIKALRAEYGAGVVVFLRPTGDDPAARARRAEADALPPELEGPLMRLWAASEQIVFSMLPRDAWLSVAILQYSLRNPALSPQQRAVVERLARALHGALAQRDPIIGKYLDLGFDPANDVPRTEHGASSEQPGLDIPL